MKTTSKYVEHKLNILGSIYLTLAIALERYAIVCHPFFKVRCRWRFCNNQNIMYFKLWVWIEIHSVLMLFNFPDISSSSHPLLHHSNHSLHTSLQYSKILWTSGIILLCLFKTNNFAFFLDLHPTPTLLSKPEFPLHIFHGSPLKW